MSKDKKLTFLQLEKSYETATKAKIKLELIKRNKDTIFPCESDYDNLKETYTLEREYALKKCRDIVATDKDLSSRKKWYDFFKGYYESRQLIRDIIIIFLPFIALSVLLGYYYKESILWLIACLDLIAIGSGFAVFSHSLSKSKKKIVNEEREYLAPTNMQIKVLREIDKALLNGQIYEEIIKDCQLQFAKRRLAEKRHNNLTNSYKEEVVAIEEKVNVEEDIADIFFGQEPTVKYSYNNMKKKKASESSVYAKYMALKNSKKNESTEVSAPESAIRYNSSISGIKEHQLSSYKDNKFIKKFVSSLDIIRSSDNPVITKAVISKPKKKASESPTYQRYMELKLAPVSINNKSISSSSTSVRIPTYNSNSNRKVSNSPTYEKYMNMRISSSSSSSSSSSNISESSSSTSIKKKKASESPIYAKYMEMKNSKKN